MPYLNCVQYSPEAFKRLCYKEQQDLEFLVDCLERRAVNCGLRRDNTPELHLDLEAPAEEFMLSVQKWVELLNPAKAENGIDSYCKVKAFAKDAKLMNPAEFEPLALALSDFEEAKEDVSFGGLLRQFVKKDSDASIYELANYSIIRDTHPAHNKFGLRFGWKFFESPFNFCLAFGGMFMASLGFSPANGKMLIEQIQGAKDVKRLVRIKWERALVNYAMNFAKAYGIPEAKIISAQNHYWMQHGHLPLERAIMHYDVTAKRCGFKKAENGNYVKGLI